MIELLAAAPDGWALVREEDSHWLVRPPYRQRDRERLKVSQVERALMDEDFVSRLQAFESWGELCRHLEQALVQSATAEERASAGEAAVRLLARADAAQARRHLDRIRGALQATNPSGVDSALIALLKANAVQSDPVLVSEIGELLALAQRARQKVHTLERPQRTWTVSDEAEVEQQAASIRERGGLLLPAA